MLNVNKTTTFGMSASELNILAKRLAERRRLNYRGRMSLGSIAINQETEDAALLNLLHQELKDINESMIRTNTTLLELVEEMKSLRISQQEDAAA